MIMALGMGVKLGVQVLSFGLVAAYMGATEFGNFATVVGAVGIVATFAIWAPVAQASSINDSRFGGVQSKL